MLNDVTLRNFEDRFQLVQSKAKDTVQSAHCAMVKSCWSKQLNRKPTKSMSFAFLLELRKHSTGLSWSQELHRHDLEVGGRLSLVEEED